MKHFSGAEPGGPMGPSNEMNKTTRPGNPWFYYHLSHCPYHGVRLQHPGLYCSPPDVYPQGANPDVFPRGANLGVGGGVLGVFWGCSGGCSGGVLGVFWGCSTRILGDSRRIPPEQPQNTSRTPLEHPPKHCQNTTRTTPQTPKLASRGDTSEIAVWG